MLEHSTDNLAIIRESVRIALTEDIGQGDVTAALCNSDIINAKVICRETATLCGQTWFEESFQQLNSNISIKWLKTDGDTMHPNNEVCIINGPAPDILTGERTALNFLQTLSATATATKKLLHRLKGTKTQLLDTRKTIPGLRYAQKYAVRCAGGKNHRMGLYDAYLIKENHIAACGSISKAIERAKKQHPALKIEVEVETLDQLKEAIENQSTIALLDNFSLEEVKQAVGMSEEKIKLEVSGNINMDNIHQYAILGVDYISVGALTKNVRAVDFSMLFHT
ncbi:MAG: carboxylating nicotinate-nucleotide diphosphorylase [Gammaproteobacteria bacterium]|nr:carboxylating nicotinate-nucleotide diphosphorylase [Gammaproteobacteria bacterium]